MSNTLDKMVNDAYEAEAVRMSQGKYQKKIKELLAKVTTSLCFILDCSPSGVVGHCGEIAHQSGESIARKFGSAR